MNLKEILPYSKNFKFDLISFFVAVASISSLTVIGVVKASDL